MFQQSSFYFSHNFSIFQNVLDPWREQNVACRDRRSRLVLLATTRFLEINVVLKLKYQLETEKSNSASANVGNCDANNFDQVDGERTFSSKSELQNQKCSIIGKF